MSSRRLVYHLYRTRWWFLSKHISIKISPTSPSIRLLQEIKLMEAKSDFQVYQAFHFQSSNSFFNKTQWCKVACLLYGHSSSLKFLIEFNLALLQTHFQWIKCLKCKWIQWVLKWWCLDSIPLTWCPNMDIHKWECTHIMEWTHTWITMETPWWDMEEISNGSEMKQSKGQSKSRKMKMRLISMKTYAQHSKTTC